MTKLKIRILFIASILLLCSQNLFAFDITPQKKDQESIEERIERLEERELEQRTRNSELDEKIEMLAEKINYSWRRQINRGTWVGDN